MISATDEQGQPLSLRAGPHVPAWGGDTAGQPGKGYAKILRDVATGVSPVASYWKQTLIEQFHRETKQVTGLESCQCRKARIVRNHIGCAILVWVRLKQVAQETNQTIYKAKHGLLSDYLRQQLKSPPSR